MLAGMGIDRIDNAQNGLEACELCRDNEYDIVFLDVSMPVLSGLDAYRRIRKSARPCESCFITGLYQDEDWLKRSAANAPVVYKEAFQYRRHPRYRLP